MIFWSVSTKAENFQRFINDLLSYPKYKYIY